MIGTTDMGQVQIYKEEAAASEKVATMNSKAAVMVAESTRDELTRRIVKLEATVSALLQRYDELNTRYNLLLTERFNTGPTVRG